MEPTCWTLVRAAAGGDADSRALFWKSYAAPIRAYLHERWRRAQLTNDVEDALQDVFVECFKQDGALHAADTARGSFRAFLFGVVRNVARRHEERVARSGRLSTSQTSILAELPAREASLSRVFDRAWALELMTEAVRRHAALGAERDEEFRQRYRILRLRIEEDLPIRTIAERLVLEPTRVHNDYRRARREFRETLRLVVIDHGSLDSDAECRRLIDLLAAD
ncbi:MAG: sigma-70 family RNA polymerase sigma factor [Planctomycetes bacterium]|nr:sigma-70 family RNA polymerase sigma factor [Planctomycetota bacterium]MCB9892684.1 sigma-70 family RNA polymerase sigma factor [Planctomycetota bacterium]MCB9919091.1 sigma-70 family RNA polymerase sigma factor [Planctomycetota bacterium]